MKNRSLSILPLAAILVLSGTPARAQVPAIGELRLKTERAVVFKDGHALLVKEARGTVAPDGSVYTGAVPDSAVLGSFWATCEASPIKSMRAEWVETTEERTSEGLAVSLRDLLTANTGREVTLTMQWPEERQVACRILGVLEREGPSAVTEDTPWHLRSAAYLAPAEAANVVPVAGTRTTPVALIGGDLVAIEIPGAGGETTQRIVPIGDVRAIAGAGLVRTCARKERVETRAKRLTFVLGTEAAGKEVALRILYFSPGMRWIPTYRLGGDLGRHGELALQAEILNELEDLDGAAVDLVVGVPNFRFGETISPLSLERSMRNVLQQAAPQLMGAGNAFSNALFTQRAGEFHGRPQAATDEVEMPDELAATGEQDLFVYTVPGLSLRKGARATVPLWSSELDLRHLYTFDVKLVRDTARGHSTSADPAGRSPLELAKQEVWHQLELKNRSAVPWTTGAALVMRGNLPLGQDLLTYTPVGGTTLLPITVAVDVRGQYEERQVSIEPNATEWNGYSYARVTKRGLLRVTNYEKEAVSMRLRASSGGRVIGSEGNPVVALREFDPRDWQNSGYDNRLNAHSELTWNLTLEPGATREVWYEVEMFLR